MACVELVSPFRNSDSLCLHSRILKINKTSWGVGRCELVSCRHWRGWIDHSNSWVLSTIISSVGNLRVCTVLCESMLSFGWASNDCSCKCRCLLGYDAMVPLHPHLTGVFGWKSKFSLSAPFQRCDLAGGVVLKVPYNVVIMHWMIVTFDLHYCWMKSRVSVRPCLLGHISGVIVMKFELVVLGVQLCGWRWHGVAIQPLGRVV